MATAKVTINDRVIMDITDTTATAETIRQGYTAYGADGEKVTGTYTGTTINNQNKTVTPTTLEQSVTYDSGYTGLGTVTVDRIPNVIPYPPLTPTNITSSNSSYFIEGAYIDDITGEVLPFYAENGTATLTFPKATTGNAATSNVLNGKTFTSEDGFGITGTMPNNGATGGIISTQGGTYTIPAGYTSGGTVTANITAGSATTPATTITANPSISVSNSGLITANVSASQDIAPDVNAGYISTGTAGTVTASGSNTQQLSTQAATTITPTESSQTAVTAGKYTTGAVTVAAIPSDYVGSEITQRSSTDLTVSGATVTVPAGYYAESASKAVSSGSVKTPTLYNDVPPAIHVSSGGLITATTPNISLSYGSNEGYVYDSTKATTIQTSQTGKTYTATLQLATKDATTYTPTTTNQTITSGTYLTGNQTISGDSNLVAENIKKDVTIFGVTGTAETEPTLVAKTVTPTAETQIVTPNETPNLDIDEMTPSSFSFTTGSTWNITWATPLVSGEEYHVYLDFYREGYSRHYIYDGEITFSGFNFNIVATVPNGSSTATATFVFKTNQITNSLHGDEDYQTGMILSVSIGKQAYGLSQVTVNGDADLVAGNIKQGVNIFGIEGTYAGSGTSLQTKSVTPTESQQEVTPDSGYDGLSKVTVGAISSTYIGSGITQRSSADLTASGATVSVPAGYYASTASKSIASGSATAPASISGTAATVSTGINTLTLTKSVSVTPTVSAGYVSSGTTGNSSVSLTANVTTQGTRTITPTTSNQTIASGTYITGTQTIAGDANLVGSNIISGKSIFGVSGTVVINKYYTGSSTPSSSLGNDGDIYLQN